jgi:hypothetical protein
VFRKPLLNSVVAVVYIVIIVLMIFGIGKLSAEDNAGLFIPIAMLSLFTLSTVVMGYLFLFTPVTLYLDGKKKESVKYLLHTIGWFAVLTAIFWVIVAVLSL